MNRTKESDRRQPIADTASNYEAKHSVPPDTKQRAKNLIVGAACWRMIPPRFAEWLIRVLRLQGV